MDPNEALVAEILAEREGKPKPKPGPPVESRWPKGVSGNPKGRPKGKPSIADALRRVARECPEGDDRNNAERLAEKLFTRAIAGDMAAARLVVERIDGRPVVVEAGNDPMETHRGIAKVYAALLASHTRETRDRDARVAARKKMLAECPTWNDGHPADWDPVDDLPDDGPPDLLTDE